MRNTHTHTHTHIHIHIHTHTHTHTHPHTHTHTHAHTHTHRTAGLLSLLDEPDPQLQVHALEILDTIVDDFWAEISDYISKMCVSVTLSLSVSQSPWR